MNRTWGILVGFFLLLVATNAFAQATAQINGTVADTSAAVLPGVTIVAIQTDTGFRRETISDEKGAYGLLNLPIGPYRLEATLAGFRSYVQTGIVLQVNSNPVIKVTLQLGELAETLTVQGQAPLVETRNPSIGQVITNQQVEALPLEGRNPTALIVLSGAAVDSGNPSSRSLTSSRSITIAGAQQWGVAYLLDGALHNNVYDGVNLPLPFPDALQEFKVETSSQNAQNGYKAGGTVGIATKAGTNQMHGDAFEFARNHRFNSTSPFASVNPRTGKRYDDGLVRNQFGGVLGGPIVKDRVQFFAAYQGTRTAQTPADIITFIPTPAMLAGDFSTVASSQCRAQGNLTLPAALGFANNQINPALFSPAAVKSRRCYRPRPIRAAGSPISKPPGRSSTSRLAGLTCSSVRTTSCLAATCCRPPSGSLRFSTRTATSSRRRAPAPAVVTTRSIRSWSAIPTSSAATSSTARERSSIGRASSAPTRICSVPRMSASRCTATSRTT